MKASVMFKTMSQMMKVTKRVPTLLQNQLELLRGLLI